MNISKLSAKTCVPCKGDVPALLVTEQQHLLKQLDSNWQINDRQHLYKQYKFKNFMQALEFVNKIAVLAEQQQHHPELLLGWGRCCVEIWTHAINGLSENDFIMAAKIEDLCMQSTG